MSREVQSLKDANRALEHQNHDEFASKEMMVKDYHDKVQENRDLKRILDDERIRGASLTEENARLKSSVSQLEEEISRLRLEHRRIDE